MVAHATGWRGGPPPPTQQEAELRAQLLECNARLGAELERTKALIRMVSDLAAAYEQLAKETK